MSTKDSSNDNEEGVNHPVIIDSQEDQHSYEYQCKVLGDMLDDINPDSNEFRVEGQNIGWRNLSGEDTMILTSGESLLRKIVPNTTMWNLEATQHEDMLSITLSHHDSPTGEVYSVVANHPPEN